MNNYKSPQEINRYADEIHMLQLKLDELSNQLTHNLDMIGSIGMWQELQESFAETREITDCILRQKLSTLLKALEHELRDQAQKSAEMREVYAPPEFYRTLKSMTESSQKRCIEYPMNYQFYSQDEESGAREPAYEKKTMNVEPDWKNGDTLTICARCHNSIPWTVTQCPFCGLLLRKDKNDSEQSVDHDRHIPDSGEAIIHEVYASPLPRIPEWLSDKNVANIQSVYASPGFMRMRGPLGAVLSSLREKIGSKKGK